MWMGMIAGLSAGAILQAGRFLRLTARLVREQGAADQGGLERL